MSSALTIGEQRQLKTLEETIERGKTACFDVGNALRTIRDEGLYADVADTFEEYCKKRWGFRKSHAYRLIDATRVVDVVSSIPTNGGVNPSLSPIGDKLPINEGQARELTVLETDQDIATAWTRAVETAPKDKDGNLRLTAKVVKEAVKWTQGDVKPILNDPAKPQSKGNPKMAKLIELIRKAIQATDELTESVGDSDDASYIMAKLGEAHQAAKKYERVINKK